MPQDFFKTFSVTTAAIPGAPSATFSGTGQGTSQSMSAVHHASQIFSQKSGQRDSILELLNALFKDTPVPDNSILQTYSDEIRAGLVATNLAGAFTARNGLLTLSSAVGHLTQLPLDMFIVISEIAKSSLDSNLARHQDKIIKATHDASSFDPEIKKPSHSIAAVSALGADPVKKMSNRINNAFELPDNSHATSHASAASTTAGLSVATTGVAPAITALITDAVGQIPREVSATNHFSKIESESQGDKNIHHASTGTSEATKANDSRQSKRKLKELEGAMSATGLAGNLSRDHGVTGPLQTVLLRLTIISLFVEASRSLNKTTVATIDGRTQKALVDATNQGPSGGVDRINSLHFNLCSLSNIMRLCAENLGGAPSIRTAAESSEVISSRALSVLMSHVSEFANALRVLVAPEQNGANKNTLMSDATEKAFGENIQVQSAKIIQQVLDQIENANGLHVIPGVNKDMASQINSTTQTGASSLLTTHSLLLNPTILAINAAEEARHTDEECKNEALMDSLPGLTKALNAIQAGTLNMMAEMLKAIKSSKSNGALLSTDRSIKSNTAATYLTVSAISLLCGELLTLCRSLTLIDQARMKEVSRKVSEVDTREAATEAKDQIAWDTHSGNPYSATHAISALRLTLSHTGIALLQVAINLHKALDGFMDTQKPDLHMHATQKSLLTGSAATLRSLAEGLLFTTGGLSAFPVTFNGSAESSHKKIHSTNKHLHPAQTHSCEDSSRGCSTQATGFSIDAVGGTVTNILKVLAQTGLIGSDTLLELIKILEIISLHRDSLTDLQLETQASSHPNGLFKNISTQPGAAVSAGTSALLINLLAACKETDRCSGSQSTLAVQNNIKDTLDLSIEQIAMLDDDEEARQHKSGLKAFYRAIINILHPNLTANDCDALIKRLDFGGINTSSYHSHFGAYDQTRVGNRSLLNRFANADDAQGVLREFIDAAKNKYGLLRDLTNQFPVSSCSTKAQQLYTQVYEEVFQHYKQIKISDAITHGSTKRKTPDKESFELDIGLQTPPLPTYNTFRQ